MNKLIKKFGKLITASFIIMGVGVIVFLLTPLCLLWDIDTDILGVSIVLIGLAIYITGLIRRKKLGGVKLVALAALASLLCIPILFLIINLIYYLITGGELGWQRDEKVNLVSILGIGW